MTSSLPSTILFDMGWTLRHTIKDPLKQQVWLQKIIDMTGLTWTPTEMAEKFTERAQAYKKWGEVSLVELTPTELWLNWLLPELPQDYVLANATEMNRYWRKAIGEGELYPHAVEVIRALFQRGYRLGIVSNTVSAEETPNLLKKYAIDRFFEIVILSCNFGKRKPDPSIFHAATNWMGVDPADCAYVGDQPDRDIAGSKQAGFSLAILVKHDRDKQEAAGNPVVQPDHIIHSLAELLDIFPIRYLPARYLPAAQPAQPAVHSNGKPTWNVTLSTMWSNENKIALTDLLPILAELELAGMELNHGIKSEDLLGIDLSRLPIRSLHEPCPADVSIVTLARKDWLISATDEQNRRQGVRMIMRTIDLAAQLGIDHVVVHPGNTGLPNQEEKKLRKLLESGQKGSDSYRTLQQEMLDLRKSVIDCRFNAVKTSLQELLDYASGKNVRLALENRYHLNDIPSPDEMEILLTLAGPERLGVQFDVGHAQALHVLGFYPFMDWVNRFAGRFVGLHLHDVRGVEDHFAPGLGELDFQQFASLIPRDALRTIEVHGPNSLGDISNGLQFLGDIGLVHRV